MAEGMSIGSKVKLGLAALGAVLTIIIILQNTSPVKTDILFVSIVMPRAVLLLVMVAIGFVLGLIGAGRLLGRKSKSAT